MEKQPGFNPMSVPLISKIHCSGIFISPRKIYYEWMRYFIPEKDYLNMQASELIILPGFATPEEAAEFCRQFYDLLFQYKLRKCINDPLFWPVNRSYEMFCQWFDIRITAAVSSVAGMVIKLSEESPTVLSPRP